VDGMTVYRGALDKHYRYDFQYRGQRYWGSTGQSKKRAAEDAERKIREKVERAAAGLAVEAPASQAPTSPYIQDWASVTIAYKAGKGRKVAPLTRDLAVCLKFFGQAPGGVERAEDEPYHHLTLREVEQEPMWVERFEQWLGARRVHVPIRRRKGQPVTMRKTTRKIGASAKNHARSAMSGLFKVALLPKHKAVTNITSNPWSDVPRDATRRRNTMVTSQQLRAWIQQAAYHVKLALAIAALAPKLRLENILSLKWTTETVNLKGALITVEEHKTLARTGLPLVVPITPVLAAILQHAHTRRDKQCSYVITYHGRRVRSLKTGLRGAAGRAGVPYGLLRKGGATFHTLRHYAATTLAQLGVPEALRRDTMGHLDISTTQIYTHLAAQHQREPLAQLAAATPLEDLFVTPRADSSTNPPTTGRTGRVTTTGTRCP
jgi:integrase